MSRRKIYLFYLHDVKIYFEVIYMVGKYRSEVGNYLKNIRKNKNITAKALGKNLKYSQSHISGIENGSKKIPPFFYTSLFKFYF